MNIEFNEIEKNEETIDDVKGLYGLKYAMTIAIAGRHNIMAFGNVGSEKTTLMQKMPQIMPKLLPDERESVKNIYTQAGLESITYIKDNTRPFLTPHPTASIEGMCGGGAECRAGAITLAHNGVLFLQEATEFRCSVLQMLRVPIECGQITLSRAGVTKIFPAKFQLAMTTETCPCGNYGAKSKVCLCSAKSVEQYWKKFSAPLLDRIDIRYNCFEENTNFPRYTLDEMREHIKLAWERQYARQGKLNADLYPSDLCDVKFSPDAERHLNYLENAGYSPRAIASIKKVAMTLNDTHFNTSEAIELPTIQMAVLLRAATPFSY